MSLNEHVVIIYPNAFEVNNEPNEHVDTSTGFHTFSSVYKQQNILLFFSRFSCQNDGWDISHLDHPSAMQELAYNIEDQTQYLSEKEVCLQTIQVGKV